MHVVGQSITRTRSPRELRTKEDASIAYDVFICLLPHCGALEFDPSHALTETAYAQPRLDTMRSL